MYLSFSQLVFIVFVGFLLFGNLPLKLQDLSKFLQDFVTKIQTQTKEIQATVTKEKTEESDKKKKEENSH